MDIRKEVAQSFKRDSRNALLLLKKVFAFNKRVKVCLTPKTFVMVEPGFNKNRIRLIATIPADDIIYTSKEEMLIWIDELKRSLESNEIVTKFKFTFKDSIGRVRKIDTPSNSFDEIKFIQQFHELLMQFEIPVNSDILLKERN